jgi:spoIIIJ-associated protein
MIPGSDAEEIKNGMEPVANGSGEIAEVAQSVLEELLTRMGVAASVVAQSGALAEEGEAANPATLDIEGDDLGILIGRRGQTLASLQYIVRLIVGHRTEDWMPVVIDVEGYKQRRYERLQALAWRLAEQAKVRREPFTLEPMLAYERRIIHLALADHPDITTESIGEGESRRVVIRLK